MLLHHLRMEGFDIHTLNRPCRLVAGFHDNPCVERRFLHPLPVFPRRNGFCKSVKLKTVIFDKSRVKVLKLKIFDALALAEKLKVSGITSKVAFFTVECPVPTPAEGVRVTSASPHVAEGSTIGVFPQCLPPSRSPDARLTKVRVLACMHASRHIFWKPFRSNQLIELMTGR